MAKIRDFCSSGAAMTSEQLRERAQKFLDGAEWDAATVGGEQEIRLLTSLLASIRAETLEECCKAVCYLCAGKHSNYAATPIISEEYSGIFHVALDAKSDTQRDRTMERCRASAIRDAGKKERGAWK